MKRKLALLMTLVFMFAFAACDDDDSNNSNNGTCGNDAIDGTEQCDGTDIGADDCTTIGQGFTGGTLGCLTTCSFDVSMCTGGTTCGNGVIDDGESCDGTNLGTDDCTTAGNYVSGTLSCNQDCTFNVAECVVDENCGNGIIDANESCDGTNLGTDDCTTAGDFTGGTLSCAIDCTFNVTMCENNTNCGNGIIDANESCDGTNLGTDDCTTIAGGYSGGTLACTDSCTFDTAQCTMGNSTSQQIHVVITTADATGLTLPVDNAYVTYTKAAVGTDPAGFFVQAELNGPALFVAVDPTTTTPVVVAGDEISFVVTEVASVGDMTQAMAITGLTNVSTGNSITPLIQDVNNTFDLVSNLDIYACEMVTTSATIIDDFAGAGTDHSAAVVETEGVTGNTNLRLRLPTVLLDTVDISAGCNVDLLGTPMWRYYTTAQLSIWNASEITINSCPAPEVLNAAASSPASVIVSFSRIIDGSTLVATGDQFTVAGLTVSAAAVTGPREVTITTSAQTEGANYDVVVDDTLHDTRGLGIAATANTATFIGYASPAVVVINEINANIPSCDLIELRVISGGSLDGFVLGERNETLVTFAGLMVNTNDYIIVHINGGNVLCNPDSSTDETTGPTELDNATYSSNFDSAYDWYSTDSGLTATTNVFVLYDSTGTIMDAVMASNGTSNPNGQSVSYAATIAAAGEWTNIDGTVPAGGYVGTDYHDNAAQDLGGTGTTVDGTSIQRVDNDDNNHKGDWGMSLSTWGANNPGQTDL